jgi:predicted ATPase
MLCEWAQFNLYGDSKHITVFEKTLKNYVRSGSRLALSYWQTMLARMHIDADQLLQAETAIDRAFNDLARHSEHFFQVEIFRLKAIVNWLNSDMPAHEIDVYFKEALYCAQRQSAASLELRTALDYSRFLAVQNQHEQALQVLDQAMEKISEGKSTRCYQQAQGLMTELQSVTADQQLTETV